MVSETLAEIGPYGASLGVEVEELSEAEARLRLPFKEENSNPGNALHGGVAASMIDLGALTVSRQALGDSAAPLHTCSVQISYLAAAIGEAIVAEARLLRRGKEICFVDVAVQTEDGKGIARGLATVRGRFGAERSPAVKVEGDDGQSDAGLMGPHLPKRSAFIGRLGLEVEHMAAGRSRIAMPFQESLANGAGGVHEGPILALLDTTGAMAAWGVTGPGPYKASTVGIQAQLVAPADAEKLIAYGRVVQRDREIFWSSVEVGTASDANVVARGTVTYRIVVPKSQ